MRKTDGLSKNLRKPSMLALNRPRIQKHGFILIGGVLVRQDGRKKGENRAIKILGTVYKPSFYFIRRIEDYFLFV